LLMARAAAPMLRGLRAFTRTTRNPSNSAGTGKRLVFYVSGSRMEVGTQPLVTGRAARPKHSKPFAARPSPGLCKCKRFVKPLVSC
jgi:hypothetical protein